MASRPALTTLTALFGLSLVACQPPPAKTAHHDQAREAEGDEEPGKTAEEAEELTDAERFAPAGSGKHIQAEPAGPLTDEEKRLIAADPKDLSKDERRKRAFALRKKIMQNPDSEQAQTILQGAEAMRRGDVEPPFPIDGPATEDTDPDKGMMVYPAPGMDKPAEKKPSDEK
jgi:hypothetical protein